MFEGVDITTGLEGVDITTGLEEQMVYTDNVGDGMVYRLYRRGMSY